MNQDLVDKLYADHPLMFNEYSSVECMDGWYILIDEICHYFTSKVAMYRRMIASNLASGASETSTIVQHYNSLLEQEIANVPTVLQIKEKFGRIRFYVTQTTDEQDNALTAFELMSGRICEICGTMDDVRLYNTGWWKTLCPTHAKQFYGDRLQEK